METIMSAIDTRFKQMMEFVEVRQKATRPTRIEFPTIPPSNPPPNLNPSPQRHPPGSSHFVAGTLNEAQDRHVSDISIRRQQSGDLSLKANKAFKLILAAKANLYDGLDSNQYRDWKDALEREVHGLTLTPAQWMDLLHVRTTKDANAAIQPARLLQRETSPEEALKIAWRFLDQQFTTTQKPSQQLLDGLVHGPVLASSNPTHLTKFAHQCQAAMLLRQSHPGSGIAGRAYYPEKPI